MFSKKRLSAQTMTGLKANFQILPWYEISYHVVRKRQTEHPKIECIILFKAAQKRVKTCSVQKLYTPVAGLISFKVFTHFLSHS